MFASFRVFMQKEFGKHHKQNKTTAKSVGFGIANSVADKHIEQLEQLEVQALMIAELANSMQEQSQKQFKKMMEMFSAKLDAKTSPNPSYPKGGDGKKKKKCPHCGMEVYHKPEACFESTLPSALQDGKASRAPEGVRRSSPQSSGDWARLISLN